MGFLREPLANSFRDFLRLFSRVSMWISSRSSRTHSGISPRILSGIPLRTSSENTSGITSFGKSFRDFFESSLWDRYRNFFQGSLGNSFRVYSWNSVRDSLKKCFRDFFINSHQDFSKNSIWNFSESSFGNFYDNSPEVYNGISPRVC